MWSSKAELHILTPQLSVGFHYQPNNNDPDQLLALSGRFRECQIAASKPVIKIIEVDIVTLNPSKHLQFITDTSTLKVSVQWLNINFLAHLKHDGSSL